MNRTRRTLALVAVVCLLVTALWGCSGDDDDDGGAAGSAAGGSKSSAGSAGSSGSGGSTGGSDGGDGAAAGACAALGDACMDDHAGTRDPTTQDCCDGAFCGVPQCTNAIPPHCRASCTCSGDGQTCREELDGRVTTERACCDAFACTGCVDLEPESRLCVCRPR